MAYKFLVGLLLFSLLKENRRFKDKSFKRLARSFNIWPLIRNGLVKPTRLNPSIKRTSIRLRSNKAFKGNSLQYISLYVLAQTRDLMETQIYFMDETIKNLLSIGNFSTQIPKRSFHFSKSAFYVCNQKRQN